MYKLYDRKSDDFKAKATNFTKAIASPDFRPSDISYETDNTEILVLDDGIFINAEVLKSEFYAEKKTKPIIEEMKTIAERYNSIFRLMKIKADSNISYEDYLKAMPKKFPDTIADIKKARQLLNEVKAIKPNYEAQPSLEFFFEQAEQVLKIHADIAG